MARTMYLVSLGFAVLLLQASPLLASSRIVIVSQGPDCIYCNEQFHLLAQFKPLLKKYGVRVIFCINSSTPAVSTWKALSDGSSLVSDTGGLNQLMKLVGAPAQLQHGSFILDSLNHVIPTCNTITTAEIRAIVGGTNAIVIDPNATNNIPNP